MKQKIGAQAKRIALGALVVLMGVLGVAGGKKTLTLVKVWATSLFSRDTHK